MKKFFAAIALAMLLSVPAIADEGFAYGVWFDSPKEVKNTSVDGVAIGVPVIDFKALSGAVFAICGATCEKATGFEFALLGFTKADTLEGVQLSFVNLQKKQLDSTIQIGGYNQTGEGGVQVGVINNSRDNALFQFGLININKNGFFPVMILVNFGKELFD